MFNETYERLWEKDLSEFAGKWIIVLDRKIVASGNRKEIGDKLSKIRKEHPHMRPLVMKVPLKTAIIL